MGMERAGVTFASLMGLGPRAGGARPPRLAEELGLLARSGRPRPPGPRRSRCWPRPARPRPSLDLGTGVLALQLRTPMLVAMAGATLQALHPERDILLGVGISSPVVTQRWHGVPYGDRPLAQVREYVTLLRACLSGEKVDFAGDFYQVKGFRLGVRLGERRPKIVLGALNPKMLRAGRRAGRRRAAQLPPRLARAVVGRAGAQAGGDADDLRLRPRRRVRAGGRHRAGPAATSSPTPSSTPTPAASSGPASATRSPRSASAHAAGDRDGGAWPRCRDRMVDAIDVMGDADTVRGHDAGLRRRRRRRARAHAAAVGQGPPARSAEQAIRAGVGRKALSAWSCADKVVVVTGGANGIGRALCRAVRRRGGGGRGRGRPRRRGPPRRWPPSLGGVGARRWPPTWPSRPTSRPRSPPPRRASGPIDLLVSQRRHRHRRRASTRPTRSGSAIWDVNVMAHVYAARAVVPGDARPGRGLPAHHRVGRRAAAQHRRRAVHRHQARRRGARRVAGHHLRRPGHQGVVPVPAGRQHRPCCRRRPQGESRRRSCWPRATIEPEDVAEAVVRGAGRRSAS